MNHLISHEADLLKPTFDDSLIIRPMRLDDLARVVEIDRLSFSLPWSENAFRYELLENPSSLSLVAELEQEGQSPSVVGCGVAWLIMDEAHIATIAVHPAHRQRGIGKRLLAEMLKAVIERGARLATLEVREGNLAARRLYRRFGFENVGRRPRYYKDNQEDAIIMTVFGLNQAYRDWLDAGGWLSANQEHQASVSDA